MSDKSGLPPDAVDNTFHLTIVTAEEQRFAMIRNAEAVLFRDINHKAAFGGAANEQLFFWGQSPRVTFSSARSNSDNDLHDDLAVQRLVEKFLRGQGIEDSQRTVRQPVNMAYSGQDFWSVPLSIPHMLGR